MSEKNMFKNKLKISVDLFENGCIINIRKGGKKMYINFKKSVSNDELRRWKEEKKLLIWIGKIWICCLFWGGVVVFICS